MRQQRKNNSNQIVWLVRKVQRVKEAYTPNGFTTFREFLDNQQYSQNSILRYERIFGRNYVRTGGKETTEVGACFCISHSNGWLNMTYITIVIRTMFISLLHYVLFLHSLTVLMTSTSL